MTPQKSDEKSGLTQRTADQAPKTPKKPQHILQEVLQTRLGLTPPEASAHAVLLAMGQLTPYEVSVYSGLSLKETEPALDALATKQLVKVMPGIVKRYFAFAPYKELTALLTEFSSQVSGTLGELQTRQQQLGKEIPGNLTKVSLDIGKGLARSYRTESKTLRAAAETVRRSLQNLTTAQRKALTNLCQANTADLSPQMATLQKNLSQSVEDGIRQLQDAYGTAVGEPLKLIAAHRQTSQQWLDSTKDQLLGHLEALKTQVQSHLDSTGDIFEQLTPTTLETAKAESAKRFDATHRQLQDAAATLTNRIQTFGKKQRQSIDAWQKQQSQITKQATQVLGQNQRESLNQVTRVLTRIQSDIDKTLTHENQRVTQDFERSTAEIASIADDWGEGATQIGDSLLVSLRTNVSDRIQAFLQLGKETDTAISQWPPNALASSQLAKLKESLMRLAQAAVKECGELVKSADKTLATELDKTSISQLGEQEALLQNLADNFAAQQQTLTKSLDLTVNKTVKAMDAQSAALLKAADGTAKSLQDQLRQQVKLGQELRQKAQRAVSEEAAAVTGVLGAIAAKLKQLAETQIPTATQTIHDVSTSISNRIDDHGRTASKQLNALEASLAKCVDETNQSLQQRLERVKGLVIQYAKDAEATSGDLEPVQDAVEKSAVLVQNLVREADSETARRIKASLDNLTQTIQQYASTNHSTLERLTVGVTTALDEEGKTLVASIANSQGRAKDSLAKSTQDLKEEHETLAEGVAADSSAMTKSCVSQLSQARTLVQTLSQDLASNIDTLAHDTESNMSDADAALATSLSTIETASDTFVQNLLEDEEQLAAQRTELAQKAQALIRQQATTAAEALDATSDELKQFVKTHIPQAKEALREASGAYLTRIAGYQMSFQKQLTEFQSEAARKCDDYVSNLQKELVQLQSLAASMTQRSLETGQTLETLLREQIENTLTNYLTTTDEKGKQLHEKVSSAFQSTLESFGKIQGNLLSMVGQDIENGKAGLEEAIAKAGSTLEEGIHGVATQNDTFGETLRTALGNTIEENTSAIEGIFAPAHGAVNTALEDVRETLEKALTAFRDEIDASYSVVGQSLNEETGYLKEAIATDVANAASALAKGSTQTKDRLEQMGRSGIQRAGDLIRSIRDAGLAGVEERTSALTTAVTQFAASASRSVSAQARQTARQVFADLKAARQAMKTEGQALAKATGGLLKESGTAALALTDTFAQSAGPALTRIDAAGVQLQQTLAKLSDSLAELESSQTERTWRIVTRQGVQIHLQDMIRRAHTTITLVYPSLKEAPLDLLTALPLNCRLHLITTLARGGDEEALHKLLTRQNIRIWHAPKTEAYAGSRDGEEVLVAPTNGEADEVVALASDHSSYVALFNKSLGPHWISNAKEVVQQKPPQR
jgi:sugar-specific transcriptional regulator TrmB